EEAEEFVFDDGRSQCTAGGIAVLLRHFFTCGDVGVRIVEKRCCVKRVGSAMYISTAVKVVGAGGGAHVHVRSAGGALLGIIHRGVDAKLLDGLGSGRRQRLADGQIWRRSTL